MTDLRVITTTGKESVLEEAAVNEFKTSLRGQLLTPGDAGYDDARLIPDIWTLSLTRAPQNGALRPDR